MTRLLGPSQVGLAAAFLRAGSLVAFPTETVYGLGAHAFDDGAVARVYAVKHRPHDNPLIVHVQSLDEATAFCRPTELARRLAQAFWPGPLTLVMEARGRGSRFGDTVAVRVPAHALALELIAACGRPLVGPSANVSGRPSPTRAEHVLADFPAAIAAVLDGGPTSIGIESTVLDATGELPAILRPGRVGPEEVRAALGLETTVVEAGEALRRSPGTRYRHYSPRVPLVLVEGPAALKTLDVRAQEAADAGRRAVRIGFYGGQPPDGAVDLGNTERAASMLYDLLRSLENTCDLLLVQAPPACGFGLALYNRLVRAASEHLFAAEEGSGA